MSLGYGYMILSLICFGMIGVFAKYADVQECKPSAVYTLAYSWSLGFSVFFILISGGGFHVPLVIYEVALPFGAASAIGGIVFMAGIRYGKISTSWLVINLSAAVPATASVMIYREPMNPKKVAVLLLAMLSVVLLWKDKQADEKNQAESLTRSGNG
ncbi:MAG: EamA family transporter [Acidobacteriaceae bacterium]